MLRLARSCGDEVKIVLNVFLFAAETKYTILVSTVTTLFTLYPATAGQLEERLTPVRVDRDLAQAIHLDRISEDQSAAERH